MADVQVTSPKYSLNWQDALKGAVVAVIMAVLTPIEEFLRIGAKIDWALIGGVAVSAFIAYMVKNFFTPAAIQKSITNEEVAEIKEAKSVDLVVKP
jgi:hypothetical protein